MTSSAITGTARASMQEIATKILFPFTKPPSPDKTAPLARYRRAWTRPIRKTSSRLLFWREGREGPGRSRVPLAGSDAAGDVLVSRALVPGLLGGEDRGVV